MAGPIWLFRRIRSATHSHDLCSWPFPDPEDAAAICCAHVIENIRPILRVTHDWGDGRWQLLCGFEDHAPDVRVVCLGCMVVRDSSLRELADLPLGWRADRESPSELWLRNAMPAGLE